jgi:hypothetical protein
MRAGRLTVVLALCASLGAAAGTARAGELRAWDGPRVTALAKKLDEGTRALYDAIYKQPPPIATMRKDYYRLKREVRHLKHEAHDFAGDLERGAGMEETQPGYEALASSARWARDAARSVFTAKDVNDRAAEVRELLNEIAPYYDPDAPVLEKLPGR